MRCGQVCETRDTDTDARSSIVMIMYRDRDTDRGLRVYIRVDSRTVYKLWTRIATLVRAAV